MRHLLPLLLSATAAFAQTDDEKILALVRQLASESVAEREEATQALKNIGSRALRVLKTERDRTDDAEIRARLTALVDYLGRPRFEVVHKMEFEDNWLDDAVWTPDGRSIVAAGSGVNAGGIMYPLIRVYDAASGKETAKIEFPEVPSTNGCRVAISPSGKLAALANRCSFNDSETTLVLCSLDKPAEVARLKAACTFYGARFLDDDRLVYSASRLNEEHRFALWRRTEQGWRTERLDFAAPSVFEVSPDRQWLVLADSSAGLHRVFETRSWKRAATLSDPPSEFKRGIAQPDIIFARDSKHVFLQSKKGVLTVRRVGSWEEVTKLKPYGEKGEWAEKRYDRGSATATADSAYLVTAGFGSMLRAWSYADWREAATMELPAEPYFVSCASSGDYGLVCCVASQDEAWLVIFRLHKPE